MNLREIAERDLEITLEDDEKGFGIPATVTDPAGTSAILKVQAGDIHLVLDPGTDAEVNTRVAHISLRIKSLENAGLGLPRAEPDTDKNPWLFEFADANGHIRKFTVSDVKPDRTLGLVTVILELIKV